MSDARKNGGSDDAAAVGGTVVMDHTLELEKGTAVSYIETVKALYSSVVADSAEAAEEKQRTGMIQQENTPDHC